MSSGKRKFIYSAIFIIENFKPEIHFLLDKLISGREIALRGIFSRIIGFRVLEDEAKLLILLESNSKMSREDANAIKKEITDLLTREGIDVSSGFISEIEDVLFDPFIDSSIVELKKKIYFSMNIVSNIRKFVRMSHGEICELLFKSINNLEFCKILFNKGLIDKILDKIKTLEENWRLKLNEHDLNIALTRIFSLYFLNEKERRKLYNLVKVNTEDIKKIDEILLKHEFIIINEALELTERGVLIINILESIYNAYKEAQNILLHSLIHSFFNNLNSSIELVLRRDGTVEEFSLEKLILSILNSGLNPSILADTLASILSIITGEKIITTDELSRIVVRSLMQFDEKGEIPAKYVFQLKTSQIVFVRDDKGIKPLTYTYLNKKIKDLIKSKVKRYNVADSHVKSLAEEIYDGLRAAASHPPLFINFQLKLPNILLEEKDIESFTNVYLKTYFPLIEELQKREENVLIEELMENVSSNIVKALDQIGSREHEEFFWLTIYNIIDSMINIISLYQKTLPSWSTMRNISVLENKIKRSLRENKPTQQFLKRLYGFLTFSKRIFVKTIRNDFSIFSNGQLEQYLRFCRNLVSELKEKI